jgi:voltage-gated sodium channel
MQGISSQSLAGKLKHVESSRIFQIVVISIIILSAIAIGAKTYDIPPLVSRALLAMDYAITYFFLAEILHNWTATFIHG